MHALLLLLLFRIPFESFFFFKRIDLSNYQVKKSISDNSQTGNLWCLSAEIGFYFVNNSKAGNISH